TSSQNVRASGTSGSSTRTVPFVSRFKDTGYRSIGVSSLFQSELFLDGLFQAFADFLFAVHRQNRGPLAQQNLQMAALSGQKRATMLFEPPFEFCAGYTQMIQQKCCVDDRSRGGPPGLTCL